jgi:hypothetical protein
MTKTRAASALALILLMSVFLTACGGGDGSSTSASTEARPSASLSVPATPAGEAKVPSDVEAEHSGGGTETARAGGGGAVEDAGKRSERQTAALATDPRRIPGAVVTPTGAVQDQQPSTAAHDRALHNSYASIRAYGEEAGEEEVTEITAALQAYLSARARGEAEIVCALLYSKLQEGLQNLAEPGLESTSCPQIYASLSEHAPREILKEQAEIDVASVRRDGARAFVIFSSGKSISADMPLYLEDGGWKVGALQAYEL